MEILGSYDFRTDKPLLNGEKIKYWMSKGAKTTDTLHNLLITENIISGKKKNTLPRKSPPKKEKPKTEVVSEASQAKEESEEKVGVKTNV